MSMKACVFAGQGAQVPGMGSDFAADAEIAVLFIVQVKAPDDSGRIFVVQFVQQSVCVVQCKPPENSLNAPDPLGNSCHRVTRDRSGHGLDILAPICFVVHSKPSPGWARAPELVDSSAG